MLLLDRAGDILDNVEETSYDDWQFTDCGPITCFNCGSTDIDEISDDEDDNTQTENYYAVHLSNDGVDWKKTYEVKK